MEDLDRAPTLQRSGQMQLDLVVQVKLVIERFVDGHRENADIGQVIW